METSRVLSTINLLTQNNDHRQELWVLYLSGSTLSSLSDHLELIELRDDVDRALSFLVKELQTSPKVTEMLLAFTETERSVACLLMLGLSIDEISKYKETSPIRVKQVIQSIRCNPRWNKWL